MYDGPKKSTVPSNETKAAPRRTPTTKIIQSKDNELSKETHSGGPEAPGGKQGKYKQPY